MAILMFVNVLSTGRIKLWSKIPFHLHSKFMLDSLSIPFSGDIVLFVQSMYQSLSEKAFVMHQVNLICISQ